MATCPGGNVKSDAFHKRLFTLGLDRSPDKWDGSQAMEATFNELEQKLKENPNDKEVQAEVAKTLTGRIAEYAKATGRSAVEVKNDVVAWAYDHPILATSMVAGAGVATGVVLSQAGVPETVAQLAGTAIGQAGGAIGR